MSALRKASCKRVARAVALAMAAGAVAVASLSCAPRNPEWAVNTNPCCGQDLMMKGIEPPEDRCADIVVDQETAMRLMRDLGGGAVTRWHVRFIPGGPACIWRVWSGVEKEDYDWVEPPEIPEDAEEPAGTESTEERGGGLK